MNINITYKKNDPQRDIPRLIVLFFVIISLSLGSLPSYLNGLRFDELEFAEKGEFETETDEKESKEEVEKDDVYHQMYESGKVKFSAVLERESENFGRYNQFVEVITPPPEVNP